MCKPVSILSLSCTVIYLSSVACGAVISVDDIVFGADALTRDTGQGLDFLDVPLSASRSYNDVSTQFGAGGDFEGFRYASDTEVLNLINNYGFSPEVVWDTNTTGDTGGDQLSGLVDLLGASQMDVDSREVNGFTGIPHGPSQRRFIQISDFLSPTTDDLVRATNGYGDANSGPVVSSYLVRGATSAVPEPSCLALLVVSLIGLVARQRRIPLSMGRLDHSRDRRSGNP